jgi:hypothetical protein
LSFLIDLGWTSWVDEAAPHGPIVSSHRSPRLEARKEKGRDPSMAARNDPMNQFWATTSAVQSEKHFSPPVAWCESPRRHSTLFGIADPVEPGITVIGS